MKYLYYKLWQLFTRIKTNDMPATNAMIFITIWQFLNLSLVYILFKYYFHMKFTLSSKEDIYITIVIIYSVSTLLNYLFLYKKREKIYEKYKDESKKQKLIGNILLILYIVGSFALVFYFGPKYTSSIAAMQTP